MLRYCRSRFFTFVFFMQKLSGISSGQNNKSCRTFHHEPNKISFAFFLIFLCFSTQFTRIRKTATLLEIPFCRKTLGKILSLAMSPLGVAGRRGEAKYRQAAGRGRPGAGEGGSKGCYEPIWVGFGSSCGRRRDVQRRPAAVSTATGVPARRGRAGDLGRLGG
jgi:hypothetical protein